MEGLARGLPSALAWPVVSQAFDAVVAVDDVVAIEAEARLATHGVLASPTGAAAFAGVLQALADRAAGNGAIPLGPAARVLVVITEGTVARGHRSVTAADIEAAAELLVAGGLVAVPTETVYGLGAWALDADAVARIFSGQGSPDRPSADRPHRRRC